LRRLVGTEEATPDEALRGVVAESTEIEGFRPLGEALEWRLADVYWEREGLIPFVRNDVPYLVNNTGRLSESAAALVFAACEDATAVLPERLTILELGAGTGLHARYFLDAFVSLCREAGRDFADRLVYVVTDRCERTVSAWQRDGLFAEHASRVQLGLGRASEPGVVVALDGTSTKLEPPFFVFCNYLLDVLPSRIVRRVAEGFEQLCVRTHLVGGAAALRSAGIASVDEARALAASGHSEDLARLLPLLPQLELETTFSSWPPAAGLEATLAAGIEGDGRVILNVGGLQCLERLTGMVHPTGFVLVNDYGPVGTNDGANHITVQRFGGSVALGVNFPLIEAWLRSRSLVVAAPDGDDERRVHTRLVGRSIGKRAAQTLRTRFGLESDRSLDAPLEEARRHVAAGRTTEAVAGYRAAIEQNPRDWQMLGEAGEYVGLQLRDYTAGLTLARSALARNPWCSTWLWNVLGDCLFCKERYDEAHEAFEQASRIDADDPRTNLNLAYTLSLRGEQTAALAALARGLAQDGRGRGAYRARLLEKQSQILGLLSERASAEQERLVRRSGRFR
jgi:Flp pilus assembly protein TadD